MLFHWISVLRLIRSLSRLCMIDDALTAMWLQGIELLHQFTAPYVVNGKLSGLTLRCGCHVEQSSQRVSNK